MLTWQDRAKICILPISWDLTSSWQDLQPGEGLGPEIYLY